jgi:flagellar protein FliS
MFAASLAPRFDRQSMASAYARVGVETEVLDASPHKLVQMLFDGLNDAMARARGAMVAGQIEIKGRALSHAARIVEEGLKAPLNLKAGGKLAADLFALYGYVSLRLTQANLNNDVAAIDECMRLIEPVRSAWAEIGPRVTGGVQ